MENERKRIAVSTCGTLSGEFQICPKNLDDDFIIRIKKPPVERLNINSFIKEVGENCKNHGFQDEPLDPAYFAAMICSEAAEMFTAFRTGHEATGIYINEDGKPEGVPAELADIVIMCFGMADYYGIDLEKTIIAKHEYNKTRPYKHGKKF